MPPDRQSRREIEVYVRWIDSRKRREGGNVAEAAIGRIERRIDHRAYQIADGRAGCRSWGCGRNGCEGIVGMIEQIAAEPTMTKGCLIGRTGE